jgi:hypothetical protein
LPVLRSIDFFVGKMRFGIQAGSRAKETGGHERTARIGNQIA